MRSGSSAKDTSGRSRLQQHGKRRQSEHCPNTPSSGAVSPKAELSPFYLLPVGAAHQEATRHKVEHKLAPNSRAALRP